MIVDEWGTWFDCEPGTNPGFLYQQNTLRDAVSGAISLNIFNNHAQRVRMANIAQTVNVLQAMILTEGEQMVLTPSYHVFDLFSPHQDAALIDTAVETEDYVFHGESVPGLSVSASLTRDGAIMMTIANPDPNMDVQARVDLGGYTQRKVSGRILASAHMNDCNDFTDGDKVRPQAYTGDGFEEGVLRLNLPKMSVVAVEIR
jgi:alpha-N-arabinofuranosidase